MNHLGFLMFSICESVCIYLLNLGLSARIDPALHNKMGFEILRGKLGLLQL